MKRQKFAVSYLLPFIVMFVLAVCAPTTVALREPPPPRHERVTAKPFPNAVWIGGHWQWKGGKYVWVSGHWVKKRPGKKWVPGHWVKRKRGWVWIKGYWR